MEEENIIKSIRSGRRSKAINALYDYFPAVKKHIKSRGGSNHDAQDIFQEALIIFLKKVDDDKFELTSSINTYIFGVSRFLWNNAMCKKNPEASTVDIDDVVGTEVETEEQLNQEVLYNKAEKALIDIGEKCTRLLQLFYIEMLSMKAIASQLNYNSQKVASNAKYKCLERARKRFKSIV